jgi:metallo-beta-lactamase family protein
MKLTFLGAAGTVTGSRYLLESDNAKILVDCGLFQGYKNLRLLNREPFSFNPETLDAVILTHAHLDHSGALPLLIKNGYRGPIYATQSTIDLCGLLLPDSGHLQEEDAYYANKHKSSKHEPALPLYSEKDARNTLRFFKPVDFNHATDLGFDIKLRFRPAGHILGASSVELTSNKGSLFFSGDIGRPDDTLMMEPAPIEHADNLIVESTYGNRTHEPAEDYTVLAEVITRTAARGGTVLIPAFAVGRAQLLLTVLAKLKQSGQIPPLPIFLDSPMAIDTTEIYQHHRSEHRLSIEECKNLSLVAKFTPTVEQSRELNHSHYPCIIISASGMATGGRVLHHLKFLGPDQRNSIIFSGFQAAGTRGAKLLAGERIARIFGQDIEINAEIISLPGMSAHADAGQIISWLKTLPIPPKQVFVTHGEPEAADALRLRIKDELKWDVQVPLLGQSVILENF